MEVLSVEKRMAEHSEAIDSKVIEALGGTKAYQSFAWLDDYLKKCSALFREAENERAETGNACNIDWLFRQLEKLAALGRCYNLKVVGKEQ